MHLITNLLKNVMALKFEFFNAIGELLGLMLLNTKS